MRTTGVEKDNNAYLLAEETKAAMENASSSSMEAHHAMEMIMGSGLKFLGALTGLLSGVLGSCGGGCGGI